MPEAVLRGGWTDPQRTTVVKSMALFDSCDTICQTPSLPSSVLAAHSSMGMASGWTSVSVGGWAGGPMNTAGTTMPSSSGHNIPSHCVEHTAAKATHSGASNLAADPLWPAAGCYPARCDPRRPHRPVRQSDGPSATNSSSLRGRELFSLQAQLTPICCCARNLVSQSVVL